MLLRVAPLNVPAAAVTVIAAEPLKSTPLIALAVAKVVAVAASVIAIFADPSKETRHLTLIIDY